MREWEGSTIGREIMWLSWRSTKSCGFLGEARTYNPPTPTHTPSPTLHHPASAPPPHPHLSLPQSSRTGAAVQIMTETHKSPIIKTACHAQNRLDDLQESEPRAGELPEVAERLPGRQEECLPQVLLHLR